MTVIPDTDPDNITNTVTTSIGNTEEAPEEQADTFGPAASETQQSELDFQKAIDHFTIVIEQNSAKAIEAHFQRGLIYLELGKFDLAVLDFTTVIDAEPESPNRVEEAYIQRGIAYTSLGQFDLALADFNQAELDDAKVHYYRGLAFAKQGKFELAIAEFSEAIKLKPDYVAAHISRGVAYAELDDFAKAVENLKQAIELAKEQSLPSEQAKAHFNLGLVYANYDKLELAIASFDKAIDILRGETMTETPLYRDAFFNRGNTYIRLSTYDDAIDDFDEVIGLDPTNAVAYIHRGIGYSERG